MIDILILISSLGLCIAWYFIGRRNGFDNGFALGERKGHADAAAQENRRKAEFWRGARRLMTPRPSGRRGQNDPFDADTLEDK